MNIGKTLFAQLMDFLPWSTFARIVARCGGDARVRTLCCAEQYRAMAFAQLTYRDEPARRYAKVLPIGARRRNSIRTRFSRAGLKMDSGRSPTRRRDWRIYAGSRSPV